MRTLNERFTEGEFDELKEKKGDRTWREAILEEFNVQGRTTAIQDGGEE